METRLRFRRDARGGSVRRAALALVLALALAGAPGGARALGRGVRAWVAPGAPSAAAPTATAATAIDVRYFGGPVVSNVQVVMVLWGGGAYQPYVQGTGTPSLASFYAAVTDSPYLDWLSEYGTDVAPGTGGAAGTGQAIGRGAFLAQVTITPSAANDGATIGEAQVGAELVAQLAAGTLAPPTADRAGFPNTVYMVHFPKGKTLTVGGASSCVAGGFCAYHGTAPGAGGALVYFGAIADASPGSGCDLGCGAGTPFQNATAVASHELLEAITDPGVGLATSNAPPLAWDDTTNGEIGDVCNAQDVTVTLGDGVSYAVQQQWSNVAAACVASRTAADDFSLALAPAARQVARGGATTYAVSTAVTSGAGQPLALSVPNLPAGLSASFSPASVVAGEASTLTVSAADGAALERAAFAVTGTGTAATHGAVASVTVLPALVVAPAAAILPPRASGQFTASGGSGGGYAWSLAANGSGGAVDAATGVYAAGASAPALDLVRVVDSAGDVATATVHVGPAVSIAPSAASVAPGGGVAFTASGGGGGPWTWSLATNASGGSIGASGAYQAGMRGAVIDTVAVVDALGNSATAAVAVSGAASATAVASPAPPSRGCGCGSGAAPASLLALAGLALRPRRGRAARP